MYPYKKKKKTQKKEKTQEKSRKRKKKKNINKTKIHKMYKNIITRNRNKTKRRPQLTETK